MMQTSTSRSTRPSKPRVRGLVLALWAASLMTLPLAPARGQVAALPSGASVAAGQAQISVNAAGNRMTVVNTPQTVLNWNSFSIGTGNTVYFQQAGASSAVLNRVTGNDPSNILGSLGSNGRVWLLNPNGVLFGASARVDVAGLVASTLRMSDADWLAGRYSFTAGRAGAGVVNEGELRSSFGGTIALLGDSVTNSGLVQAPGGQIVLAAGSSVELVDTGAPNLSVKVTAPAGEARNLGTLQAAGGRIDIHAAAVNSSGIVSADGFDYGPGGEVWIKATGTAELAAGSVTSASSSSHSGGRVVLQGQQIGLLGDAQLHADGASGGGQLVVGGGTHGAGPAYSNARAVYVDPQARLSADSTLRGDGGSIVLWSNESTRAYGSFSARGGPLGGNGGFIETSGGWLDARPAGMDVRAPQGRAGLWLLDPTDLLVLQTGSDAGYNVSGSNPVIYTASVSPATITAGVITTALDAGTNVFLSTGVAGSDAGIITVSGAQLITSGSGSLTLQANAGINVTAGAAITMGTGDLTLNAGIGPIKIDGSSNLRTGTGNLLLTGGTSAHGPDGSVFLAAGGPAFVAPGVELNGTSSLRSGTGSITIGGQSSGSGLAGVQLSNSAILSNGGSITIRGESFNGPGVVVSGSAGIISNGGPLTVQGLGAQSGVEIGGSLTGSLQLFGVSSQANAVGLYLISSGVLDTASNAATTSVLRGFNAGGAGFPGVRLEGSVLVTDNSPLVTTRNPSTSQAQSLDLVGPITMNRADSTLTMDASFINTNGFSLSSTSRVDVTLNSETGINFGGVNISLGANSSTLTLNNGNGPFTVFGSSSLSVPGFNAYIQVIGSASNGGAVSNGAAPAVFIGDNSTLTTGSMILKGDSTGTGAGVQITDSSVTGTFDFSVVGRSTLGPGVSLSGATSVLASGDSMSISGTGGTHGVLLLNGQLQHNGSAGRSISGTTTAAAGGTGVTLGTGLRATSNTTAPFIVSGSEPSGGNMNAVRVDNANLNVGELTLQATSGGGAISIANSTVVGRSLLNIDAGSGSTTQLTVSNSSITSASGPGDLRAAYQTYTGTNTFTTNIDELRFMQANATPPTQPFFDNQGTMNMVTSGTGRWVVFASDINSNLFRPGNLVYDFKLYGATGHASWAGIAGNGFASLTGASAAFNGNALSRPYDGTTVIAFDNGGTLSGGIAGDHAVGSVANKNVGTAKPVTFSIVDANNKPVYYSGLSATGNLTADITRLNVSLTGVTAASRPYDGSRAAQLLGTPGVASLSGDVVTLSGTASATFQDKQVGSNKPVNVSGLTLGGADAGNYTLQPPTLTADITPLALALNGLTASDKVYDATTLATLSGKPSFTPLAGDSVTLAGTPAGTFADKNVGSGKAVTVSGLTLGGNDGGNYVLQAPGLTASITPLNVSLAGLTSADKVYDATTRISLTGTGSVAVLAGDQVSLGGTVVGDFADKNVGAGKPVTVTGAALSGADAGNYRLQTSTLTGSIQPRPVSLVGLAAQDKVYDGKTTTTLSGSASVAALAGDTLSVVGTASGSFSDRNVGSGKSVALTGLTLGGADASNYTLQPVSLSASITPRLLALSGLQAADKVYDATPVATLLGAATIAPLTGDSVSLGGVVAGRYADKNVGSAKAVTLAGLTLVGSDAGNYSLQLPALSSSITQRPVDLNGLSSVTKVYDGTTSAPLGSSGAVTALPGDDLRLGGSGAATFSDKNVGSGKPVAVSGLALVGADASNYTLRPATLTGTITPRPLQASGLTAASKVYDAGTGATLLGSAAVSPLAGDQVQLGGVVSGSFADQQVGSGKVVSVNGLSLSGADAANYALQLPALSASITARPVTVAGVSVADKRYDGTTTATLQGTPTLNALAGDTVTLVGSATARFPDAHPVGLQTVQVAGWTLGGADAGNYALTLPPFTATLLPAVLSYVAQPVELIRGQVIGTMTGSVTGFVAGETLASATTGTAVFSTTATSISPAGSYPITGSGLQARDYVLGQAPGNTTAFTLNPVPVTPSTPAVLAVTTTVGSSVASGSSGGTSGTTASAASALPSPTASLGVLRSDAGLLDLVASTGSAPSATPTPPASGTVATTVTGTATEAAAVVAAAGTSTTAPAAPAFSAVRLGSLSTRELAGLLATRQAYIDNLFAESSRRLTSNPALADMKPCQSLDEAVNGQCLVTAELKARLKRVPSTAPSTPVAAVMPTVPPTVPQVAPAAAPAAPASVTATAAPTAPALPAAAPPRRAAVQPGVARVARLQQSRRAVQQAALPQIQRKLALVIGNGVYEDSTIPALANAVRDAQAVARTLESKLGYEAVVLENASKAEIVAAMNRIALTAGSSDSVMIYFAGHGELVATTQQGYWLPADANAQQPEGWLSNADINRLVAQIGASQVALISDSCYSGTLASEDRLRAGTEVLDPAQVLGRKSVVVMSSGGNQPVADEGRDGHSPFAYHLMESLGRVSEWQAGGNVFERVRFAVARALPQRPQYSGSRSAGHQPGGEYLFEQRRLGPEGG